ncbi:cell division protein ZapA [Wenzhouxiangella sp. XN201]|jgi:cell division protein ZapA|uniref:cell division protein ZapA n=1 Tax=Wenzhouxiangella sp. XN201 TaxID=2710755 RepID=UPI0013C588F4|nr:cell division protein ZapA [Wenzhouxiangella sp. XN201]NEZ03234.1 cell division protein ZapA [Wenzhouxiangella sp. XN201]
MSESPEPVTVRIVDREYRVMCTPDQRRTLMESALFLDQQMREIRDSGKVSSMDKIAVMAALNLAEEVLRLRQNVLDRRDKVDARVRDLADRLDRALEQD